MPLKLEEYNGVGVLTLDGDFNAAEADAARKGVDQAIDQKQIVDFVVDFQKSAFIDSEGLETLLWMRRKCEELFGQVKLAALDEHCRKILEITRLDSRFEVHPDLPAALRTIR